MGVNAGGDEKLHVAQTKARCADEWMSDGELRHSRFVRLRQDKEVADIIPEE